MYTTFVHAYRAYSFNNKKPYTRKFYMYILCVCLLALFIFAPRENCELIHDISAVCIYNRSIC